MKTLTHVIAACSIFGLVGAANAADLKPAPDFSAVDENGKTHKLSDYKGKVLVLEFTNPGSPVTGKSGCPYMVPRYEQKVIQNLAEKVVADGGAFLSVNSNYYNTAEDSKAIAEKYGVTHPTLIDTSGTIAKAYDAKTTPDMIVVNKEGMIVYAGALNDNPSPDVSKDASAMAYVELAAAAAKEGKLPQTSKTQPYGCGIKFAK